MHGCKHCFKMTKFTVFRSSICPTAKSVLPGLMLFHAGIAHTDTELTLCRGNVLKLTAGLRTALFLGARPHKREKHANEAQTAPPAAQSFLQTSGSNRVSAQFLLVHLVKAPTQRFFFCLFFFLLKIKAFGKTQYLIPVVDRQGLGSPFQGGGSLDTPRDGGRVACS